MAKKKTRAAVVDAPPKPTRLDRAAEEYEQTVDARGLRMELDQEPPADRPVATVEERAELLEARVELLEAELAHVARVAGVPGY